jgi:uncharacterized protein DUF3465
VIRIHFVAIVAFVLIWAGCGSAVYHPEQNQVATVDKDTIGSAFETGNSDVQVEGEGVVTRLLADDNTGSRHQRFIVRLASGQTLLISHNIDIAPRVPGLRVGDSVSFYGEYVWNEKGGVIHWTHRDPLGKHVAGWLKHKGKTYQ